MVKTKPNALILTSTYPRWKDDSTPAFVQDFTGHIASSLGSIHVLAPHFEGAARRETRGNIYIHRYRYFLPTRLQDIAYNGGGISKIKATPIYVLKLGGLLLSQFFSAMYLIFVKRIDVINAHWLIPQGFLGAILKFLTGRKLVITVHGSDVFALNGRLFKSCKRFALKHADVVVVNSSATLEACQELYGDREYLVIPMGIDTGKFARTQPSKDIIKKYKLSDFTILFVGRLSKEKGIAHLVKAAGKLKKQGKKFTLLIVGDGPERTNIEAVISEQNLKDDVVFAGWIENTHLVGFYNSVDILVGPSLHEALGLVFIEAAACGLPVIATNTGGIKDIVIDNETGYLVKEPSADLLTEKLAFLMENPSVLERFSKNSRKYVLEKFSWQRTDREYSRLFQEITNKSYSK